MNTDREIALVLGSGGARGLCGVGVLLALEEAGYRVVEVSGCSMGAIVGSLYCSGRKASELEELLGGVWLPRFLRLDWFGRGLFTTRRLAKFLEPHLARRFEELSIPLSISCTDLGCGQELSFSSGELLPAVMGSASIAGFLTPVEHEGVLLADGGYTNPVPVNLIRSSHCKVIAVDCTVDPVWDLRMERPRKFGYLNKFNYCYRQYLKSMDILCRRVAEARNGESTERIRIRPVMPGVTAFSFHKSSQAIEAGRVAMRDIMAAREI